MDFQTVFIPAAIIAVTKFIDLLEKKDYRSAGKIVIAVVVGAVAGVLNLQGLTIEGGVYAALVASGLITTATRIGK